LRCLAIDFLLFLLLSIQLFYLIPLSRKLGPVYSTIMSRQGSPAEIDLRLDELKISTPPNKAFNITSSKVLTRSWSSWIWLKKTIGLDICVSPIS
jgi:hypothetical protein